MRMCLCRKHRLGSHKHTDYLFLAVLHRQQSVDDEVALCYWASKAASASLLHFLVSRPWEARSCREEEEVAGPFPFLWVGIELCVGPFERWALTLKMQCHLRASGMLRFYRVVFSEMEHRQASAKSGSDRTYCLCGYSNCWLMERMCVSYAWRAIDTSGSWLNS
jgi:hypothetical protein